MSENTCEICSACGARITERRELLSPGLCASLVLFYQKADAANNYTVHLQKDITLSNTEYTNFYKLRYFGLVEKTETSGAYRLTDKGRAFLRGGEAPLHVWVKRNVVTRESDEKIVLRVAMNSEPYWLKREDFAPVVETEDVQASLFD
jgi:hypothetical protein